MSKYILIALLAVALTGCVANPEKIAEYEAQQAQANAQAQQAIAAQQQAQAQQEMYRNETQRFDILADAVRPTYWPFVLCLIVVVLVVYMNHRAQLAHTAMLTGQRSENVRLLPGDVGFERALLDIARARGVRPIRGSSGAYYLPLPDGGKEKVTALTIRG